MKYVHQPTAKNVEFNQLWQYLYMITRIHRRHVLDPDAAAAQLAMRVVPTTIHNEEHAKHPPSYSP